jgi:general secretion pathway protein D
VVTSIIEVENTPVEDIQKVVQSFVTANATIVTYDNMLILTDTATNIRRIQRLVKRLDQDGKSGNVYVYKVAHAEAGEVQQKLSEIFEIAQSGANNARNNRNPRNSKVSAEGGGDELDVAVSQIIADERTNQLIIVSDERSFRKISQMLELLDVPTEVGGQIHVKFLEYADAEELSGTLSTLASGSGQRNTGRTNARRGTVNSAAAASNPQAAQLLSGEVQVTAHTPTNSLIIVASPRDYMSLERVVNLLDRPRRQVWVEAVIMEISLGQQNDTSIGFNGGLGQDFDGLVPQSAVDDGLVSSTTGLVLGQSNFGDGFTSVLGAPGGALGLLGPSLTIPGIELTIPAFAMFLQATQTDSNINVLSTPSLLALDNEESEIVVGDRVPFPQGAVGQGGVAGLAGLLGGQAGGAAAGLGGLGGLLGGGLLNQVTYEDVGITLRIKPQVNESKYVRLEVDQEVSSVGAPTDFGPTRSKRSIKTIVLVKDQSTVVIGGLIRDDENDSETKVPFLGDIPLLGLLFRTTNTTKTKQNLVLMLTPYIIESEADLNKIRERKRKERQELLRLFQRRDAEYMSRVDYGKKSGVIDRMRRNISDAKLQEEARRKALEAFEQTGPRYQILGTTPAPAPGKKDGGEEKPGAVPVTDGGE